jgi:hypothetical protein
MAESFPDIEIYIKNPDTNSILAWLGSIFESVDASTKGRRTLIKLKSPDDVVDCLLLIDAVKGNFASLWFQSSKTHWKTDKECALDAFAQLHQEIRCSTHGWETDEIENEETWLKITGDGESTISWQA